MTSPSQITSVLTPTENNTTIMTNATRLTGNPASMNPAARNPRLTSVGLSTVGSSA